MSEATASTPKAREGDFDIMNFLKSPTPTPRKELLSRHSGVKPSIWTPNSRPYVTGAAALSQSSSSSSSSALQQAARPPSGLAPSSRAKRLVAAATAQCAHVDTEPRQGDRPTMASSDANGDAAAALPVTSTPAASEVPRSVGQIVGNVAHNKTGGAPKLSPGSHQLARKLEYDVAGDGNTAKSTLEGGEGDDSTGPIARGRVYAHKGAPPYLRRVPASPSKPPLPSSSSDARHDSHIRPKYVNFQQLLDLEAKRRKRAMHAGRAAR